MPIIFSAFLIVESWLKIIFKKINSFDWLSIASKSVFVTNFFSLQLFGSMLQVFNCVNGESGSKVLNQEPSINCYGSSWTLFVVFDALVLVFYLFCVPGLIYLLYKKTTNDDRFQKVIIAPLTSFYRPGCEWFEAVRVLFRFCFILVRDVLGLSNSGKITFLSLALMTLLWIESRSRPYLSRAQQDLSLL
jgi:hypothetical protein